MGWTVSHPARRQTVCKPGSVLLPRHAHGASRGNGDGHSSGTFVAERLTRPTRAAARKARPAVPAMPTPPAAPTWSCSRWGLPCHRRCRRRGALLPHHFTLAARPFVISEPGRARRYVFCGTFPRVAPAGRYPAPCLRGARTFLPLRHAKSGHPTVWHGIMWESPPPNQSRINDQAVATHRAEHRGRAGG